MIEVIVLNIYVPSCFDVKFYCRGLLSEDISWPIVCNCMFYEMYILYYIFRRWISGNSIKKIIHHHPNYTITSTYAASYQHLNKFHNFLKLFSFSWRVKNMQSFSKRQWSNFFFTFTDRLHKLITLEGLEYMPLKAC